MQSIKNLCEHLRDHPLHVGGTSVSAYDPSH